MIHPNWDGFPKIFPIFTQKKWPKPQHHQTNPETFPHPIPSHPHLPLQVIRAIRLLRGIAVLVLVLMTPHQRTAALHLEGQRRSLVTLAVHGGVGAKGDQKEQLQEEGHPFFGKE